MPILVEYDPTGGADLLSLAAQTGRDTGQAANVQQQRAIDARTSQMAIAGAQERNARPGFYERVSQGAAAEGERAQDRFYAQENADREFDLASRQLDMQAGQAAAAEQATRTRAGDARALDEQHARLLEDFDKAGATPEAARKYMQETTRRGIKANDRIADFAGPLTPAEQTARERAAATTTQQGAAQSLGRDRLGETQRHNRAMEETARMRAQREGLSATDQRRAEADELAGWGSDPMTTLLAFEPGLDGRPSPAAVSAYRGVLSPTKSPGQILARVKELEDAGLPPAVADMMRREVAGRQVQMEQQRVEFMQRGRTAARAIATLPPAATAQDVGAMLQRLGMTIDEYEVFLNNEEQEAGLAPPQE